MWIKSFESHYELGLGNYSALLKCFNLELNRSENEKEKNKTFTSIRKKPNKQQRRKGKIVMEERKKSGRGKNRK